MLGAGDRLVLQLEAGGIRVLRVPSESPGGAGAGGESGRRWAWRRANLALDQLSGPDRHWNVELSAVLADVFVKVWLERDLKKPTACAHADCCAKEAARSTCLTNWTAASVSASLT